MSAKNRSSSEAASGTSARRAMPGRGELEREALDGRLVGAHADAVAGGATSSRMPAWAAQICAAARVIGRAQRVAAGRRGAQLVEAALVDDAARADDRDAVAELLDLVHEVAREQHRDAARRRARG